VGDGDLVGVIVGVAVGVGVCDGMGGETGIRPLPKLILKTDFIDILI